MSPKVVNGSFAALFDNEDDWSRKLLRSETKDSSCKYIINNRRQIVKIIFFLKMLVICFNSAASDEKKNSRDSDVGKTVFFRFSNGSGSGNGTDRVEKSDMYAGIFDRNARRQFG